MLGEDRLGDSKSSPLFWHDGAKPYSLHLIKGLLCELSLETAFSRKFDCGASCRAPVNEATYITFNTK